MALDKIGEWTVQQLSRFIAQAVHTSAPSLPPSLDLETVKATRKLIVADEMELSPQAIAYLRNKLGLP